MEKLVQKINWNLPDSLQQLYMYGEASIEANQEMQEPLQKLYQYENQPDMRDMREMMENFEEVLNIHVNMLNQAFEDKNYSRIIEESEKITKIGYVLCIMKDNKDDGKIK